MARRRSPHRLEAVAAHLLPAAALKPTTGPTRDDGGDSVPLAGVPYDEVLDRALSPPNSCAVIASL